MERLAQQDREAFVWFYRTHASLVARLLVRSGVNGNDLDDMAQVVFLEAMLSVRRFGGRSSLRGWLAALTLNQARKHIQARIRGRRNESRLCEPDTAEAPSAEALLVDAEQRARVQRALDTLPALQREALVLCELAELPAAEVAALLGVPAGTVWRRVHDAKISLRERLR